jgi:hypothetical protein
MQEKPNHEAIVASKGDTGSQGVTGSTGAWGRSPTRLTGREAKIAFPKSSSGGGNSPDYE